MLTKYSLQKQLVIIFSIIAIGVLAILLPIIDNNLTHVIDNEMYDVLTRSQNDFYSYDFSPDYAGSDKQIYHFTYNINEDTLTTAQNISAKKYQILDYVFQNDLYKMQGESERYFRFHRHAACHKMPCCSNVRDLYEDDLLHLADKS